MPSMVSSLEYLILIGAGIACVAYGILAAVVAVLRKHK